MRKKKAVKLLVGMHPLQRVLVSLGFTGLVLVSFLLMNVSFHPLVLYTLLWDVFAISYIVTGWIVFYNRTVEELRTWARIDDGSRIFVSFFVVLASIASLVIVLLLMLSKEVSGGSKVIYLPVAITGMLASWVMVHTTLTFHYANLYYDDDGTDVTKHAGGLEFPSEKHPDYIDFAYFSFVIGMTFQVSDVEISRRVIRRTALAHGLLSFALNTFVVALTINLIAGLKQ
ncbi:DUF1345 domain-containing protein [Chitinophaga eiseniae]|uniref:DUF1345 domain-containing protein n=1 Tax=Chitinophaga eiseniae TaxID=634771 RepID=A0A847SH52_9BACT|nr:DUF1345 domain-containing protein [Chitinophaga eiseniae]NLR82610.1 DUF1345 domain-containing protein [Chitinophaga eiseniae]